MWLLSFLPDNWLHLAVFVILGTGCALYLAGLFLNLYPPAYPYREPIRIISTVLMIAGVYFYGSYDTEMEWRKKVEEVQAKLAIAQEQSNTANVQIQTKIVVQKQIIHDKQIVVQKEIQEVEKRIDSECKLDPVIPKILNDAAVNPTTVPPGGKK
jgi:hypothetical protein